MFARTSAAGPGVRIQGSPLSLTREDTLQPTRPAQEEEAPAEG